MGSTKKSLVHCVRISHRPEKLITFNGRKSCDWKQPQITTPSRSNRVRKYKGWFGQLVTLLISSICHSWLGISQGITRQSVNPGSFPYIQPAAPRIPQSMLRFGGTATLATTLEVHPVHVTAEAQRFQHHLWHSCFCPSSSHYSFMVLMICQLDWTGFRWAVWGCLKTLRNPKKQVSESKDFMRLRSLFRLKDSIQ